MADPTEADKAKAQALYPLSYMGPHLRDAIAQALADEREAMRERCAVACELETHRAEGHTKVLHAAAERIRRLL